MSDSENMTMDAVEQNLVWLAYEDYTGLWQAAIEVRDPSKHSEQEARELARRIIRSLLNRGWIQLYRTDGLLINEALTVVPAEEREDLLERDDCWSAEDETGPSVWFGTTDEGFAAYQAAKRGS